MSSSRPSLAELREVAQPPSTLGRASGEHWAGLLYMRRLSLRLTRLLVPTRATPNGLTWTMLVCGLVAAAVLTLPSVWAAVGVVLLIQLQQLLDCSDGELARWRRQTGAVGIYVDRMAHYVTDAGMAAAVGVSAAGGPTHLNGWTTIGLGTGMLVLITKAETDLVHMARVTAGLPPLADTAAVAAPRRTGLVATGRRIAGRFRFNRALLAVEMSFLAASRRHRRRGQRNQAGVPSPRRDAARHRGHRGGRSHGSRPRQQQAAPLTPLRGRGGRRGLLGQSLGVRLDVLDAAAHEERLLGRVVELAVAQPLERVDRLVQRHELAGDAGELLGDEERLREEPLDPTGPVDRDPVLLGELVDTEDRDDVLQVAVALQDLLGTTGDVW